MTSPLYGGLIQKHLAEIGRRDISARHVEAFMRLEHPTLDALSPETFRQEVLVGVACVDEGGTAIAERAAQSFGL